MIGEIETPENILRNVVQLAVDTHGLGGEDAPEDDGSAAVASVTIIMEDNEAAGRINALLHEYNELMVGRLGLPHRRRGLYIINATLDGPRKEIEELTHRLGLIRGISVKTTYARGEYEADGR